MTDNIADKIAEVECRQRFLNLLAFRNSEDTPPIPWHLISNATSDNPFQSFSSFGATYRQYFRKRYDTYIIEMYGR